MNSELEEETVCMPGPKLNLRNLHECVEQREAQMK